MQVFYITVSVIAAASALVFLISYITYRMAFYSNRDEPDIEAALSKESFEPYREKSAELINALAARPFLPLEIKSHDGLTLFARYYEGKEGSPIHIMFHGYKSASGWDFSGGAEECIAVGHGVILPDQRAHGKSEGRTIAFGVLERYDVLSWAEYAHKRFGGDIFLWGISMGAASVLMAHELPLPSSVRGIIADCPYSSPAKIIKRVARGLHLPAGPLFPFVRLGAVVYGGFRLGNASPESAVAHAKLPTLLIHGEADNFVPIEMSRDIEKAASEAGAELAFHSFPNAHHGISYLTDSEKYRLLAFEFVRRHSAAEAHGSENQP